MLKSRHRLQVKRLNIFYYGTFMKLPALTLKNVPRLSFLIFNFQINLDNCVLVRRLLMKSVKKNN